MVLRSHVFNFLRLLDNLSASQKVTGMTSKSRIKVSTCENRRRTSGNFCGMTFTASLPVLYLNWLWNISNCIFRRFASSSGYFQHESLMQPFRRQNLSTPKQTAPSWFTVYLVWQMLYQSACSILPVYAGWLICSRWSSSACWSFSRMRYLDIIKIKLCLLELHGPKFAWYLEIWTFHCCCLHITYRFLLWLHISCSVSPADQEHLGARVRTMYVLACWNLTSSP